jgi:hypothetical protein
MFQNLKEKLGIWTLRGALQENSIRQKFVIWMGRRLVSQTLKEDSEMEGKKWFESKTIWMAVIQGAVGVFAAVVTANPALATVGWVLLAKSVLDILLRMVTDKPVGGA